MKTALSEKASVQGLGPRKTPAQPRAAVTVHAILEGAASLLERQGLEGYTTNEIAARAGVSIGSLYQYFPNKDAVTIALIEREMVGMVDEVLAALALTPPRTSFAGDDQGSCSQSGTTPTVGKIAGFRGVPIGAAHAGIARGQGHQRFTGKVSSGQVRSAGAGI